MNLFWVLVNILSLFFHVKAQTSSGSDGGVLRPFHPRLAVVIGIIAITISPFLIIAYAKFCRRTRPDNLNRQNSDGLSRSRSRFSGIGEDVIESLPFFRFSSVKGSKEGMECAVCISRFEDTEVLRLLPKCKHVFHKNCIDQWLKSHSSCPLCRYRLDPMDLKSFTFSKSLRYVQNPSNLTEDPTLEIFVQREQAYEGSSRLNLRSSDKGEKEESRVRRDSYIAYDEGKFLHKFKHKIIISDVLIKNRWSDVNSSDFLSLNSEMLKVVSSNRFSALKSSSARFCNGSLSSNENLEKIKVDIERKRLFESKFSGVDRGNSVATSSSNLSKILTSSVGNRSMSEITNFSRFRQSNGRKEERIRSLWLSIARPTIRLFAGPERNLQELGYKRQASNV